MAIALPENLPSWLMIVLPILMAFASAQLGWLIATGRFQSVNLPVTRPVQRRLRVFYTGVLFSSTVCWLWVATLPLVQYNILAHLAALPSTGAGSQPYQVLLSHVPSASEAVKGTFEGEALARIPQGDEIQAIRKHLSNLIMKTDAFRTPGKVVTIPLSHTGYSGTIQYLIEEYPGLLSMMYEGSAGNEKFTVLYYPEIAGEQLYFTPLVSPAANDMTSVTTTQ